MNVNALNVGIIRMKWDEKEDVFDSIWGWNWNEKAKCLAIDVVVVISVEQVFNGDTCSSF